MEIGKKTILVVEDDLDLQNLLADSLKLANSYEVYSASDGEEAVNIIVEKKPKLVLLDLLLPKLDGFKVLERIRNYPDANVANSKVIVLSNLWSNKDILKARALKIEEYLVKASTSVETVVDKVKKLFGEGA